MKTLPLPDIIARIVTINGCEESVAQTFLKEFATSVEKALADSGAVTVKGLGTFRRIELGDDVTVEFAAEPELSEAVNMPFAMFEPVELDDDLTEEMLDHAISTTSDTEAAQTEDLDQTENTPVDHPTGNNGNNNETNPDNITDNNSTPDPSTGQPQPQPTQLPPDIPPVPEASPEPSTQQPVCNSLSQQTEPADSTPVVTHEKIIEKECVVKVQDSPHSRLTILLASALSLIAGLLIGYFAYDTLNITNVKSVNISADDVQVFHQVKSTTAAEQTDVPETDNDAAVSAQPDTIPAAAVTPAPQPAATNANTVVTDTIRSNRFLTTMALQHYGKKKFWVYIYEENRSKIDDPDHIAANTVVIIPPAAKYGIKSGDPASETDAEKRSAEIMKSKKRPKS